ENPGYLNKTRQVLRKNYGDYSHVHFVVIARDYFPWFSDEQITLVEHGVFKRALKISSDLNATMTDLKRYEWLPVEGTDFVVMLETHRCGDALIELEGFHPASELAAHIGAVEP